VGGAAFFNTTESNAKGQLLCCATQKKSVRLGTPWLRQRHRGGKGRTCARLAAPERRACVGNGGGGGGGASPAWVGAVAVTVTIWVEANAAGGSGGGGGGGASSAVAGAWAALGCRAGAAAGAGWGGLVALASRGRRSPPPKCKTRRLAWTPTETIAGLEGGGVGLIFGVAVCAAGKGETAASLVTRTGAIWGAGGPSSRCSRARR
jgi:hypothetical protein